MSVLHWLLDWWVRVVSWRFGWVIPALLGVLTLLCAAQVVLERAGDLVLKDRAKSEKEDADGGG